MFKLKDIKANKGATINKFYSEVHYTKGYQVSKRDIAVIPAYKLRKAQLIEILDSLPLGSCLGVWIDNGKAYIDQSAKVDSKRVALKLGRALNQISIWDWQASKAIAC